MVLEGERLAPGVDLLRIADQTDGFSGSDLRQLCVQAAMRPVRTFLEEESSASAAATAAAAEAVTELEAVTGAAGGGSGSGEHAIEALGVKSAASLAGSIEEGQEENGSDGSVASAPAELVPAAAAQAGGSCDGWEAGSHPSLRLVPRLDSLLRQAERIASVPRNPKTDLRPVTMQASMGREAGDVGEGEGQCAGVCSGPCARSTTQHCCCSRPTAQPPSIPLSPAPPSLCRTLKSR